MYLLIEIISMHVNQTNTHIIDRDLRDINIPHNGC